MSISEAAITVKVTIVEECETQTEEIVELRKNHIFRVLGLFRFKANANAEAVSIARECNAESNEGVYYVHLDDKCNNSTCKDACSILLKEKSATLLEQCYGICEHSEMKSGSILNKFRNITLHSISASLESAIPNIKFNIGLKVGQRIVKSIEVVIGYLDDSEYDEKYPKSEDSEFC